MERERAPPACGLRRDSFDCGDQVAQRSQTSFRMLLQGAEMGDKGGKKDKEKNKQQQLTKHKEEEQKKLDKAPTRTP
jgi:hypothetical protein